MEKHKLKILIVEIGGKNIAFDSYEKAAEYTGVHPVTLIGVNNENRISYSKKTKHKFFVDQLFTDDDVWTGQPEKNEKSEIKLFHKLLKEAM